MDKETQKLLQTELLTILTEAKVKQEQRRPSIFSLLNHESKAPYKYIVKYFVDEELNAAQAKTLWEKLLAYREDMVQTFGNRISLHIAAYHLTRDPDSLEEVGLPGSMRSGRTAQSLAVQELKAWWERCSESGAHLKEVMDQQLDRLVYRAVKNHQNLSFVLIKITTKNKSEIDAKLRSTFARHLMDSCRCRDIVGHYERELFAIIFPQTPPKGAAIAINRVKGWFYEKFDPEVYQWLVSITACPDNGTTSLELTIKGEDTVRAIQPGVQDEIAFSEGQLSKMYLHYVRHPISHTLHSPIRMALAILIVVVAIGSLFKLNEDKYSSWGVVMEQKLDEEEVFPGWQWGRGSSEEALPLEGVDGFISHANEFILEDQYQTWLTFNDASSDRIRLDFDLFMSSNTEFELALGSLNNGLKLLLTHNSARVYQAGDFLYQVEYASVHGLKSKFRVEWGANDFSLQLGEKVLLGPKPLPVERKSSGEIYMRSLQGYAFVSKTKLFENYDENPMLLAMDEQVLSTKGKSIEELMAWLESEQAKGGHAKAVWAEIQSVLLKKIASEEKQDWVEQLKALSHLENYDVFCYALWKHASYENEAELLKAMSDDKWSFKGGETLEKALKEPNLNREKIEAFQKSVGPLGWVFVDVLLKRYKDIDTQSYDLLWEEVIYQHRKDDVKVFLYLVDYIKSCHGRFNAKIHSAMKELLRLNSHDIWTAYSVLRDYVDSLDSEAHEVIFENSFLLNEMMLLMLQLKYLPEGELRLECIERTSLDIGKTYIGKLMNYEWMWLTIQGKDSLDIDDRGALEQLTLQSRYPSLAQEALKFQESH